MTYVFIMRPPSFPQHKIDPPMGFNLIPCKWKSSQWQQNPKLAALVTSLTSYPITLSLIHSTLVIHMLLDCFLNARHDPNLGALFLLISLPEMLFPEMILKWPSPLLSSELDSKIIFPVRSPLTTFFKSVGSTLLPISKLLISPS